ncbi:hypothetical protein M407DRAFT_34798 [Tulasnella calospora MUT 4182]|uniref:Uncharacterized protein n=1 Tax=Tulasnella calospora MUT 4182 TaxID=1051891 RepID=A0A0C3PMP0_9AGAM|nr:hypothetical protein M407DRAFT_34798 [Tulasnella calospora MUT 4182]
MKRGGEQPIRIVIPGRLVQSWFFAGARPANQVTIDIIPLSKNDKKVVDDMTRVHTGKAAPDAYKYIHASAFMTPPGKATAEPFTAFFDFSSDPERGQVTKALDRLDVGEDLNEGNIVAIECHIRRYKRSSSPEKSPSKTKSYGDGQWIIAFSLLKIFLIERGPRATTKDNDVGESSAWLFDD